MPQIAFVDEEVSRELNKISSGNNEKELFPEHAFLSMCIKAGISYEYLENFTYVDIMKILISFINSSTKNTKKATQSDIDKLLG